MKNVPETTLSIFTASIAESTLKQYNVAYKRWWEFCEHNNSQLYDVDISTVLKFLKLQFDKGASYATINSYRSALSLISITDIGNNNLLNRFFKGLYRLRPQLPKYNITWDPTLVLTYLSKRYPNEKLSLEQLTCKSVTLLALVTAQRVQTLSKITIDNITEQKE